MLQKNGKKDKSMEAKNVTKKQVNEDVKEEIRQYFQTNENRKTTFQHATKQFLEESLNSLTSRNKKTLKQPNSASKRVRKRRIINYNIMSNINKYYEGNINLFNYIDSMLFDMGLRKFKKKFFWKYFL